MENCELKIFEHPAFGHVRVINRDEESWFVGADLAEALEFKNTRDALMRHVDFEDKMVLKPVDFHNKSGNPTFKIPPRGITIVNESGLYSMILRSDTTKAKDFKHWVTAEVLPSVRKNGGYIIQQETKSPEEIMADAFIVAQNIIADRDRRIAEQERKIEAQSEQLALMAPKVKYADEVLSCPNAVSITVIAKDYGWTGAQMNKFLHDQHVQYKSHSAKVWVLYDKYAREGYTSSETGANITQYGTSHAWIHTKWTQKGRMFIYELMKKYGYYPICER